MCPVCLSLAGRMHNPACPHSITQWEWPDSWLTPTEAKALRNAA